MSGGFLADPRARGPAPVGLAPGVESLIASDPGGQIIGALPPPPPPAPDAALELAGPLDAPGPEEAAPPAPALLALPVELVEVVLSEPPHAATPHISAKSAAHRPRRPDGPRVHVIASDMERVLTASG